MPGVEGLTQERRAKRERFRGRGEEPYPYEFPGRVSVREVLAKLAATPAEGAPPLPGVRVAGRLLTVRQHGKNAFLPLRDQSGEVQLFLRAEVIGEERYQTLLADLDAGDLVGVEGVPLRTKRGEPSVEVRALTLLAKALRPPPEKWHGLQDPEARIRQRYVDLLSSPESFRRFEARSAVTSGLRRFLEQEGFQEVETAVLTATASGGAARPFVTHYNFLDEDLRLRIALELPLKRLLVGGMERVFEIGKNFRNEDLDTTHSPEFTMMELYWAYADYGDVRRLVERALEHLARVVAPFLPPELAEERLRDFRAPFATVDYVEELERASGVPGIADLPLQRLQELARGVGARIVPSTNAATCLDKLLGHYVEPRLTKPTFVLDYPTVSTPLAKRHRSKPGRVERFELFYRGVELANAYSELNDPDDQEARFREQERKASEESEEEHYAYDEDFVEALRYGMPPAGGLGMGIDRLTMALLGVTSIKDVILFPATRTRPAPG